MRPSQSFSVSKPWHLGEDTRATRSATSPAAPHSCLFRASHGEPQVQHRRQLLRQDQRQHQQRVQCQRQHQAWHRRTPLPHIAYWQHQPGLQRLLGAAVHTSTEASPRGTGQIRRDHPWAAHTPHCPQPIRLGVLQPGPSPSPVASASVLHMAAHVQGTHPAMRGSRQ